MGLSRAWVFFVLTSGLAAQGEFADFAARFEKLVRQYRAGQGEEQAGALRGMQASLRGVFAAYLADDNDRDAMCAAYAGARLLTVAGVQPGDRALLEQVGSTFLERGRVQSADTIILSLARCFRKAGDQRAAAACYARILDGPPSVGRARARQELAQIEQLNGNIARAEDLLDRAAEVLPEVGEADASALAFHIEVQRVRILVDRGLNAEAFERLRGLKPRVPEGQEMDYAIHRIDVLLALGRASQAMRVCERECERYPSSQPLRVRYAKAATVAGRAAPEEARKKELYSAALRAISSLQRSGHMTASTKIEMLAARLDALEGVGDDEQVVSVAAEIAALVPGDDDAHLQLLARSTTLESATQFDRLDKDGRIALLSRLQSVFDRMVDRWRKMPVRRDPHPFLHYRERRRLLGELLHAVHHSGGDDRTEHAFAQVLRLHRLGSFARRVGVSNCSFESVRRALTGAQRGALVYAFASRRSAVFALDQGSLSMAEIPAGRNEVRALSRLVSEAILAGRDAKALAGRLADLLVPEEMRKRLASWRHVSVVSSGDAGPLPFSELPLAEEGPLRSRASVSFVPSLPVAVYLVSRNQVQEFEHDFVLLSSPQASDHAKKQWAETVRSPVGAPIRDSAVECSAEDRVLGYSGKEATLDHLVSDEAASARVVTVLAHGVVDDKPSLVLSPSSMSRDGVVNGDELHQALRGRSRFAQLVVLFACGAAKGAVRSGDDSGHRLASAFLEAGARAVLLAPGTLTRNQAWAFAAEFQAAVAKRVAPAEALRLAQQRLGSACGLLHLVGDGMRSPF